jgi:hypothetical protein
MEHITTSRTAMALLVVAAFIYAFGIAFAIGGYAALTPTTFGTAIGLLHAAGWLRAVGWAAALAAVCVAGRELLLRGAWASACEVGTGALGALLITIGMLINATSAESNPASSVVSAVGVGVWALLALSRAARRSLSGQEPASEGMGPMPREGMLWLLAAAGLFILAIGSSLTPDFISKGIGVAAGAVEAVGVAILFGALAAARAQGGLPSRAAPVTLAGLASLAVAFAAAAGVSGAVFGPDATLAGLRAGVLIVVAIQMAAVVVLGLSAWLRVREAVAQPPMTPAALRRA